MKPQSAHPTWWRQAQDNGWIPNPSPPAPDQPSYWMVAVALLGALVCTLPLAALLAMLLPGAWEDTPAVLGVLCLIPAVMCWRQSSHLFLACMGLVLWSTGVAFITAQLVISVDWGRSTLLLASGCVLVFQLGGCTIARMPWLQCLMGFAAGCALYGMAMAVSTWWLTLWVLQLPLYLLCLGWMAWVSTEAPRMQQRMAGLSAATWALFIDAALVGLLASAVFFLESQPQFSRWLLGHSRSWDGDVSAWLLARSALASLSTAAATAWLMRRWKPLYQHTAQLQVLLWLAGTLLIVGAWFSPNLAWLAMIAAAAFSTARWRIAALCGLLAVLALGAFYYNLAWSLAAKGVGLMVLGAVLLLGLLWLRKTSASALGHTAAPAAYRYAAPWAGVLIGAALIFGVLNWDVYRKEQVIAQGQRILVPLVPVDPRSLMQGDYMALRFALPQGLQASLQEQYRSTIPVVATLNAQGHASVQRVAEPGDTANAQQVILPLQRLKGRWTLVTDAYFFPEGQGAFFESARFGDFRVLPNGRALLVGLADANGQAMVLPTPPAQAITD